MSERKLEQPNRSSVHVFEARWWFTGGLLVLSVPTGIGGLLSSLFVLNPGFSFGTGRHYYEEGATFAGPQLLSVAFLVSAVALIVVPFRLKRTTALIAAACVLGLAGGMRIGWVGAYLIQPSRFGFALLTVLTAIYAGLLALIAFVSPPNSRQWPLSRRAVTALVATVLATFAFGWFISDVWLGYTGRAPEQCAAIADGYYSCFRVDLSLYGGGQPPSYGYW